MSLLVVWVVMAYGLVGRYQYFGGTYCSHLQGRARYPCIGFKQLFLRFNREVFSNIFKKMFRKELNFESTSPPLYNNSPSSLLRFL
jgi:hypothetical protein